MGVKLTAEQKDALIKQYKSGDKQGAIDYVKNVQNGATTTPATPTTQTTPTKSNSNVQWSATNYKDSDGYYSGTERNAATGGAEFGGSGRTTPTKVETPKEETPKVENSDIATKVRNTWDSLTYEQQQEKLKNNPNLQASLTKYGATNKAQEETPVKEETPKGKTETTTPKDSWDYQDNSPERMMQIVNNLEGLYQSDPGLFTDEQTFRNFFINGKGRTPEQEAFLMDYYKNRKTYNKYDGITAENAGNLLANGKLPQNYLDYVKNSNPDRYNAIMDAKDKAEDQIRANTSLDTVNTMTGEGTDTITSNVIEWLKSEGLFVDKDGNLIDDRTENYASEEEQKYLKELSDLAARNVEIDNTVKHTYEDLVDRYPGASKATLMAMAQDINSDLLREKENNNVEMTRFQGYVNYMQSERQERDAVGQNAINQLQKQYGMYYSYSPEGMSELAQAQYAATNVTLDQADNGTDTQKQMALQSVLDDYYEKYGSIIQRSEAQVINDVMALAKKKGISLSQALQENFITPLKNKEGYKAYEQSVNSALSNGSWTLEAIKDGNGNIVGYVRINKNTGEIVPYAGTPGAGASSGVYNETTGVFNYAESGMKGAGLKNNNPGNITDSNVGEVGRNGKFAVFETPEDGFDALVQKIQNAQNGLSKNYPATATLYQFFEKYAPKSDNNDPKAYAESVASQLGVSPNVQIKDLDTIKFAAAIAKHDSGYDYSTYGMFRGSGTKGTEDHSDNPARSPMYDAIQKVLDSGDLSSAQLENLKLADIIYRQFYNLASDGSLDHFIESKDFQNIMAQMSKKDFTKAGNDEGASFLKYWEKAIEKNNITDQTNLRVIRVLTQMIEKKLRKESGAAISSSEWLSNFENYLPQAGESRDNKLATMLDWELNIIEPAMRYSGVKDYQWLFRKDSPYYKTEGQSGNYYSMNNGNNLSSSKGTWDIGVGTVVSAPSGGGQYADLFSMLGIG